MNYNKIKEQTILIGNSQKVVIFRNRPKQVIRQTILDQQMTNEMFSRNKNLYHQMEEALFTIFKRKPNMTNMLALGHKIAESKSIKLNRLFRRSKRSLICWFCENASELISNHKAKQVGDDKIEHNVINNEDELYSINFLIFYEENEKEQETYY